MEPLSLEAPDTGKDENETAMVLTLLGQLRSDALGYIANNDVEQGIAEEQLDYLRLAKTDRREVRRILALAASDQRSTMHVAAMGSFFLSAPHIIQYCDLHPDIEPDYFIRTVRQQIRDSVFASLENDDLTALFEAGPDPLEESDDPDRRRNGPPWGRVVRMMIEAVAAARSEGRFHRPARTSRGAQPLTGLTRPEISVAAPQPHRALEADPTEWPEWARERVRLGFRSSGSAADRRAQVDGTDLLAQAAQIRQMPLGGYMTSVIEDYLAAVELLQPPMGSLDRVIKLKRILKDLPNIESLAATLRRPSVDIEFRAPPGVAEYYKALSPKPSISVTALSIEYLVSEGALPDSARILAPLLNQIPASVGGGTSETGVKIPGVKIHVRIPVWLMNRISDRLRRTSDSIARFLTEAAAFHAVRHGSGHWSGWVDETPIRDRIAASARARFWTKRPNGTVPELVQKPGSRKIKFAVRQGILTLLDLRLAITSINTKSALCHQDLLSTAAIVALIADRVLSEDAVASVLGVRPDISASSDAEPAICEDLQGFCSYVAEHHGARPAKLIEQIWGSLPPGACWPSVNPDGSVTITLRQV